MSCEKKFILRYDDKTCVTGVSGIPLFYTASQANQFRYSARALQSEVPEAIDIRDFGVIK